MLSDEQIHVPHLIDSEVASSLRRKVIGGEISAGSGWAALDTWRSLAMTRYPIFGILDRIWQLRDNISAYDACYVALAESLDSVLLTADRRLAQATGLRCPITVVPR
jgi:predicted nucleic acid-binding protein